MRTLLLGLIRFYQKLPLASHASCRLTPRCSEYSYQAIVKYGILRGSWLGLSRLSRCHPWHPYSYDPVV